MFGDGIFEERYYISLYIICMSLKELLKNVNRNKIFL